MKKILLTLFILLILGAAAGGVTVFWGYNYYTRDLPTFTGVDNYQPSAVSTVYSRTGVLVGEFYDEKRYPVALSEIPHHIRQAFLAAEDASFYKHPGIDIMSILRALVKNVRAGSASQGGSTITQQVVKNILLTKEKSLERKIKEAILAYRIEQRLTKNDILEIYLNQIFFGSTAYGIKAAAKVYFRKELADVTLAEAAMLAGLPKAPSHYSPISNFKKAKERQGYVLSRMVEAGFVTPEQAKQARDEKLKVYSHSSTRADLAPYYTTEIRRIFEEDARWKGLNLERDGLEIHTALDLEAYDLAQASLQKGLEEVDKRRGWRGPLRHLDAASPDDLREMFLSEFSSSSQSKHVHPSVILSVNASKQSLQVFDGKDDKEVLLSKSLWARRFLDEKDRARSVRPESLLKVGDIIEVSSSSDEADKKAATLDQTPKIQGALVLIDPHSGQVPVVVGGYDFSRSQFNRATQALRQPGSAFKPIVYLAAIDTEKYTPATIVQDAPRTFKVGDDYWTPGNYDHNFLGPITLRSALEKSRNLVSADIIAFLGIDTAINYARKLGIESDLGRNLSLSLGSSEVTPLEITRAYGVFASGGLLFPSVFITKVIDRNHKVLFDAQAERLDRAERVIPENSAFVMANLMKGVVQHGTGYRIRELKRPAAGKTGTSNDQMDAWFVGYTPDWALGVWVGFDQKRKIGAKETGGRVSSPIWLDFMQNFLPLCDERLYSEMEQELREEAEALGIEYVPPKKLEPNDFQIPEGVEAFWIDKATGRAVPKDTPGAYLEYFKVGTEPSNTSVYQVETDYWDSPEL